MLARVLEDEATEERWWSVVIHARATLTAGLSSILLCGSLLAVGPALATSTRAARCGEWRWPVKTLSDHHNRDVHFSPTRSTVSQFRRRTPPSDLGPTRPRTTRLEFHTWTLRAKPRRARIEGDGDIHLIMYAPKHPHRTMIVEFPKRSCVASPFKRKAIARGRRSFVHNCGAMSGAWAHLKGLVDVTGVGFWDSLHGQPGVAPNGIELHPVLRFSGACSNR
jgi:hypothetical protein